MDRPRVEMDRKMEEDQRHIDRWALLAAYAWSELKNYDEMPESIRGELLIGWSASYLEMETE